MGGRSRSILAAIGLAILVPTMAHAATIEEIVVVEVPAPAGPFTGALTSAGAPGGGALVVTGWAVDRTDPGHPASVVVTVEGVGGPVEYLVGPADRRVPGLATGVTGAGERHGFELTVAGLASGPSRVCADAVSADDPGRRLGCRTVDLPESAPERPSVAPARRVDPPVPGRDVGASTLADAPVVTLNDNGGWCWFEDERAVFTSDGRLLAGTTAESHGPAGTSRDGDTEVAELDLRSGRAHVDTLHRGLVGDDHDTAAFLELPDGRTLAGWSGHREDEFLRRAERPPAGFTWEAQPAVANAAEVTYNNFVHLTEAAGGQGLTYNFFRGPSWDPEAIVSADGGRSWSRAGQLVATPGKNRPYVRYVSDGRRRVDFTITDGHPRNVNGNSVYHGYLQDGRLHRSDGTVVARLGTPVLPSAFTLVSRGVRSDPAAGVGDLDAWPADIELDGSGRPLIAFSTRHPSAFGGQVPGKLFDHRYHRARWTPEGWDVDQISYAGGELYAAEPDYTGLVVLDPSDPNRVFVSTNVHPATNDPLVSTADGRIHYELFEGTTADDGGSWDWAAVTANSSVDNLRPVVPRPNGGNWALLWLRGDYLSYTDYRLEVVGVVNPDGPVGQPALVASDQLGLGQQPLVGDFDGDGTADLFLYRPGTVTDAVLLSRGSFRRRVFADVRGTYRPVVLDADGNGRDDVLWYAPGSAADSLWLATANGSFRSRPLAIVGSYRPAAGDFDGNGFDDVYWAAERAGPNHVWWLRAGAAHASEARPFPTEAGRDPFAGDFDGDGIDDLVWNGDRDEDRWWRGRSSRHFVSRPAPAVDGRPRAAVGDLDADADDDIAWQRTDGRFAELWSGQRTGFARRSVTPAGPGAVPLIVDVNGDGRSDLYWYLALGTDRSVDSAQL